MAVAMGTAILRSSPEDSSSLLESCERDRLLMLRRDRQEPIHRYSIDHPSEEEEITRLKEELLRILAQF